MTTQQAPIGSGFGVESTAAEVMAGRDLSGQVAIVTGGYDGLGLVTARALAEAGAQVIVPVRSPEKAAATIPTGLGIATAPMDLMDPGSIDAFAETFLASGRPLHLLIANAGIMACPLTRDARGFEAQFSTNHLGHFQLAQRLRPALERAQGARVVALSSRGHQRANIDFDDWNFERRAYEPWTAYGQSKTANVLFAVHLDRIGQGDGIRAFAVHPGGIITNLAKHMSKEAQLQMGAITADGTPVIDPSRNLKTLEQGAATTLWAATSPQLDGQGGVYCENGDIAALVEQDSLNGVRPYAIDPVAAERLWGLSERLTA